MLASREARPFKNSLYRRHKRFERVHLINVRLRDRPERLPVLALSDTDLFPLLRVLVSAHEYDAMAEDFEKKEHQLFGEDGFEKMAHRVASLE